MKTYYLNKLSKNKLQLLLKRPAIDTEKVNSIVKPILQEVKEKGSSAIIKFAKMHDGLTNSNLLFTQEELRQSAKQINKDLKLAIDQAFSNIYKFHLPQFPKNYSIQTVEGINCQRVFKPIENVGLYIPAGSAVLFSTMLMLGIPAIIAGCKRLVVCSPIKDKLNSALAYSALKCGVNEFYKIGGAQAIGLMAYGTNKIEKVNKIFGPGNQFVTAAKSLVSIDADGCPIDMPAGPSEVLIIADETANPKFVASDLLSQAEHGADSQVILVTTSKQLSVNVIDEIDKQLISLQRNKTAKESLKSSFILIVDNLDMAVKFSNQYAPEHLILNVKSPKYLLKSITNAGSVFVGPYSPESAGDYASGTNHSLPTYGYAKSFGGVCVESFMKPLTFQTLSKYGLKRIAPAVIKMAEEEKLQAHANAIKVRLKL